MISIMNEYVHGAATIPGAVIACIAILSVIFHIFAAVGLWKMFKKAGVKGWYSLVPFVNNFQLFKIAGSKNNFFWWLGFKIVYALAEIYHISIADTFSTPLHAATTFVFFFGFIASADLLIHRNFKLSMAFGRGNWFGLFLTFFYSFCYIILGFGDAKYDAESVAEFKNEAPQPPAVG